ncbi:MAG: hypothetical protein HY873_10535, partial [Chloroflexi bacterium]|nr:hypothetical protein [Chloroflexota bacterium]
LTLIENDAPEGRRALARLYPKSGRAHTIGLTGSAGAGQDEVEVAAMADTTVVVLTPGAGDDVQAMKAGIMEIADVLVVNKCDLPNADLFYRQLSAIYESFSGRREGWEVPILKTSGAAQEGIDALADALDRHRAHIESGGTRDRHRLEQARHQVLALARQRLLDSLIAHHADGRLEDLVAKVARRELDPHTAADQLTS